MFLLFADDLNVFKVIKNVNDCTNLQSDISRFENWCSINDVSINTNKCSSIFFFRNCNPLVFEFKTNGQVLKSMPFIKDLGIIFSSNLMFDNHILLVCNRTSRILGFAFRISVE